VMAVVILAGKSQLLKFSGSAVLGREARAGEWSLARF